MDAKDDLPQVKDAILHGCKEGITMAEKVKKLTIKDILAMKKRGEKASSVSVYDYPFAKMCDEAGIDIVIAGGSLGMVCLGYANTVPVTMDQIIHHTKPLADACKRAVVVGALPFGAYQVSDEDAVRSAIRVYKEAGADSTKIEGGGPMAKRLKAIVDAGIPCQGHVGFTPQYIAKLGGFKAQGRNAIDAKKVLDEALELQEAGAWAIEVECVAAPVAEYISEQLDIPTVGIGSGSGCDIEVQIIHDLLGMFDRFVPRHTKQYMNIWKMAVECLKQYDKEVKTREFPASNNTFKIPEDELRKFHELARRKKA